MDIRRLDPAAVVACALLTLARSGVWEVELRSAHPFAITPDDRGHCLHLGTACVPGHQSVSLTKLLTRLEREPTLRLCTCATSSWEPWTTLPPPFRSEVLALATWQASRATAATAAAPDLRAAHRVLGVNHPSLSSLRHETLADIDAVLCSYMRGSVWDSHRRDTTTHLRVLAELSDASRPGVGSRAPDGASIDIDAAVWVACQPRSSSLRALAGTAFVGASWAAVTNVQVAETARVVGLTDFGSALAAAHLTGGVELLCAQACVCGNPQTCHGVADVEEVSLLLRCAQRLGLSALGAREVLIAAAV